MSEVIEHPGRWQRTQDIALQVSCWAAMALVALPLVSMSLTRVALGVLVVALLVHRRVHLSQPVWWALAFSASTVLAQYLGGGGMGEWDGKRAPLYFWAPLLLIPCLPLMVRPHLRIAMRVLQVALGYAALLTLLQVLFGYDGGAKPFRIAWSDGAIHDSGNWGIRPTGSTGHWMIFGVFFSLSALAATYWRALGFGGARRTLASTLTSWVVVAIFNRTRMAVATFLTLLPFALGLRRPRTIAIVLAALLVAMVVVALLMAWLVPEYARRLDITGDVRWELFRQSWPFFADAGLWGHGATAFEGMLETTYPDARWLPSHPHNTVLGIGIAFGWIPLAIFLIGQLVLTWYAWRQGARLAFMVLAMYHGCGLLDYELWNSQITILAFALVAVDLALRQQDREAYEGITDL